MGSVLLLVNMNNAAMDICVQVFGHMFSFLWSGMAGSYSNSMSIFLKKCQTVFQKWLHCVTFLPAMFESYNSSTPSPALVIICLPQCICNVRS